MLSVLARLSWISAQLDLLDNVGAPVIDNVFGLLLDTPANLALVEAISSSPAFQAIIGAYNGLSSILGPFERALLVRLLHSWPASISNLVLLSALCPTSQCTLCNLSCDVHRE